MTPEVVRLRYEKPVSVLTIDLEEWFCVCGDDYYGDPRRWAGFEPRVEAMTETILGLLAAGRHRATFFVLGWVAEEYPDLVRSIARSGHEIAFHGMAHRRCSEMSPEELRSDLRAGRSLLEPLSERSLIGFRAPEWSIRTPSDPSLRVLAEEGFRYDASLTPIPPLGAADNPWFPSELRFSDGVVLREFPPLTGRAFFRTVPMGGSWPFRVLRASRTAAARERMRREGSPAVFTFHPWELDPQHPAMDGLSPIDCLVHFAGRSRARGRVVDLLGSERMHALDELWDAART